MHAAQDCGGNGTPQTVKVFAAVWQSCQRPLSRKNGSLRVSSRLGSLFAYHFHVFDAVWRVVGAVVAWSLHTIIGAGVLNARQKCDLALFGKNVLIYFMNPMSLTLFTLFQRPCMSFWAVIVPFPLCQLQTTSAFAQFYVLNGRLKPITTLPITTRCMPVAGRGSLSHLPRAPLANTQDQTPTRKL